MGIMHRRCHIGSIGIAAALAFAVTACGGDGSGASSASSGGGPASTDVAKAKAFLQRYSAPPTRIPVSQPLKAASKAGQTLTYLQCDAPQCKSIGDAMAAAAKALGWRYRILNYKLANPATLIGAMQQSLQQKPVAVTFTASPYAVWKGQIPAFRKAGTALIPLAVGPAKIDDTVVANIVAPSDSELAAKIVANWFIVDSSGKGKAVLYSVPDLPSIKVFQDAFLKAVSGACSGCSVVEAPQSIPDALAGKSNQAIVSALQRDRDAKYVIHPNFPLTVGLPGSLKAVGLDDVKIAGGYAGRADQALIKQGQEAAGTPQLLSMQGWMAADAAARHAQGMPIEPASGGVPNWLLTRANIETPADSYDRPADFEDQYTALWSGNAK